MDPWHMFLNTAESTFPPFIFETQYRRFGYANTCFKNNQNDWRIAWVRYGPLKGLIQLFSHDSFDFHFCSLCVITCRSRGR